MNSRTTYRPFIAAMAIFIVLQVLLFVYFTRAEKIAQPWMEMLLHPFTLFFLICITGFWFLRKYKIPATLHTTYKIPDKPTIKFYHFASLIVFLLLFSVLLQNNPYYFLQDDNYAQFSPVIINGLDGWYNQGSFPTYNPLQLAGSPTFSYSTYAFLYPGTHISYLFSRFVLNDVHQFCNVFAFLHFALGYWFCYRLLLRCKLHPALAIAAALSFVFCGFNLMAVRSWYYVAPTIFFLPAIFYTVLNKPVYAVSQKNIFWPVVLFTVYAYSGNFQYWVYTFVFFVLFELIRQKQNGSFLKGLLFTGLVGIISLILFAPQLLSTWHETRYLPRSGGMGAGILPGAGALVFPYIGKAQLPNGWGQSGLHQYDAFFYYGGFVFLLLAFAVILYGIINKRFPLIPVNRQLQAKSFMLLLALAFVLSLGASGLLWWVQAKLPVLNKFNHPFKLLLFVQFFGIVSGAVLLQQLFQKLRPAAQLRVQYGFAVVTIMLIAFNIYFTRQAFYVYPYKIPYTEINRSLFVPGDYRVMPVAPVRSPNPDFSVSMMMNFPTAYGIPSMDGYEPLNNMGPDIYRDHRAFGIRYFILSKQEAEKEYPQVTEKQLGLFRYHESFKKILTTDQLVIYEDSLYEPVVQLYDASGAAFKPYRITYRNNGVDIQTTALGNKTALQKVKLNFMYRNGLYVYYDNQRCRAIETDSLRRMIVNDTGSARIIQLRYRPFPF